MPDVHDLMRLGAGPVGSGPDLAAVAARARVLQRQRAAARGGLVSALAAVLVLAGLQLAPGAGDERLRPVPLGPAATPQLPDPTPAAARAEGAAAAAAPAPLAAGAASSQPPPAGAAQPAPVAPGVPRPTAPPTAPAVRPQADAGYPASTGCSVTTEGAAPQEQRTCRFTATAEAGYEARHRGGVGTDYPAVAVDVERDGQVARYTGRCATGVIRPGDRVTLTLTNTDAAGGVVLIDLRAGPEAGC